MLRNPPMNDADVARRVRKLAERVRRAVKLTCSPLDAVSWTVSFARTMMRLKA
jgi:hypothetical protein